MDYSKLKYYRELREMGIISDPNKGDIDGLINTLEDWRHDYSMRIKAAINDSQKENLNGVLTVIEGELKELLEIKEALNSGIIIEEDESTVNTVSDQNCESCNGDEPTPQDKSANAKNKRKKGIITVAVAAVGIISIFAVLLLHNTSSDNTMTNQANIENTDDNSQTYTNTDTATIIEDGKFVITCGELEEVLFQRLRNVNPTILDFAKVDEFKDEYIKEFKKSGYLSYGSNYDANGNETVEAILVKVLPPKGDNSYDEIIQSYAFYSTDELDLSKYYAEGINLADPTVDVAYVAKLLSKEYEKLKDIQPNDESIPIDFSIFDFNNVKVYFAVDRGMQWCVIADPGMNFKKQFKECINVY